MTRLRPLFYDVVVSKAQHVRAILRDYPFAVASYHGRELHIVAEAGQFRIEAHGNRGFVYILPLEVVTHIHAPGSPRDRSWDIHVNRALLRALSHETPEESWQGHAEIAVASFLNSLWDGAPVQKEGDER
jgi:hypothetical protein